MREKHAFDARARACMDASESACQQRVSKRVRTGADYDARNNKKNDEGRLAPLVDKAVLVVTELKTQIQEGSRELLDHEQEMIGSAAGIQ